MGRPKPAAEAVRKTKPSEQRALDKAASAAANGDADSRIRMMEEYPDIADVLPELAARSRELATIIAAADKERKEINKTVGELIAAVEENPVSIQGDDWVAVRTKGRPPKKIDATKLLDHGVPLETIQACTVEGEEYWYVQVRAIGKQHDYQS